MSWTDSRYTELTVVSPRGGAIGLNADGLNIEQVLVDGSPASFETPQQIVSQEQCAQLTQDIDSITAEGVADAAYLKYLALLQAELQPGLIIFPRDSLLSGGEPAEPSALADATEVPAEGCALPASREGDAVSLGEVRHLSLLFHPLPGAWMEFKC